MRKKRFAIFAGLISFALIAAPALAEVGTQAQQLHAPEAAQPELLDLSSWTAIGSIIWVLIFFAIVVIVLYKAAWKNVLASLKAREERIRKDIADAEAARQRRADAPGIQQAACKR